MAIGCFTALVIASAGILTLGGPGDGADPVMRGCRNIHGPAKTGEDFMVKRGSEKIATFSINFNPSRHCGLIWAEFLTVADQNGQRPPFIGRRIARVDIAMKRMNPEMTSQEHGDSKEGGMEERGYRHLWTPALRLEQSDYRADLRILYTDGRKARKRLSFTYLPSPGGDA